MATRLQRISGMKLVLISILISLSSFARAERLWPLNRMPYSRLAQTDKDGFYSMPVVVGEDYKDGQASVAKIRADFATMKKLGIGYLRFGFSWYAMEPEEGRVTFDGWDSIVDEAKAAGIKLLPYVAYVPNWANGVSDTGVAPKDPESLGRFMKQIVTHYQQRDPGVIVSWELWNEPDVDTWKGTAEQFTAMIKSGALAVHANQPSAAIVLGGLTQGPSDFFDKLVQARVQDYIDVFAYHVYPETWWDERNEEILPLWQNKMTAEIKRSGIQTDLWLNEFGYADFRFSKTKANMWSDDSEANVFYKYEHTSDYQAVDFMRTQVLTLAPANVSATVWYRINDFKDLGDIGHEGDSVNLHLGLLDYQGQPKPVYYAVQTYKRLLGGPVRTIDRTVSIARAPKSKSIVHVFEQKSGDVIVTGWIRSMTVKEGDALANVPNLGELDDPRSEDITIKLPQKYAGSSLELVNAKGDTLPLGSVKLDQKGLLTGVRLTGDQIFLLRVHLPNVAR